MLTYTLMPVHKPYREISSWLARVAMLCAIGCVLAYGLLALQFAQRAYDGITSVTLQLVVLGLAVPVGTLSGALGLGLSESGSSSSVTSGWALAMIWLTPAAMLVVGLLVDGRPN